MSKKVLDEMILEMLQEKINVNINQSVADIKKDLGNITGRQAEKEKLRKLAALDGTDIDTINDEDFRTAFKKNINLELPTADPDHEAVKTAKYVRDNTQDQDIKSDIAQAAIDVTDASDDIKAARKEITGQESGLTKKGKQQSKKIRDYVAITRAKMNKSDDNTKKKVKEYLKTNQSLGAGLGVPDIRLDQLVGQQANADAFLKLAAEKLGTANDISEAVKKICTFTNSISRGNFSFAKTSDQDRISEILSRMTLVQSLLSATRGFENSPLGFVVEGFFALLIQGQVMGSNQEGEDFVHLSNKKVTLYSSKFLDSKKTIKIGSSTAERLLDYMGSAAAQKAGAKKKFNVPEASDTITYILGHKDSPNDPKIIEFYTAEFDRSDVTAAITSEQLPTSKLKRLEGATLDLTDASVEAMYKNFSTLAQSLAVDLNAVYKSMNNFKVLVNTYFLNWDQAAAEGASAEFVLMKKSINEGFKTGAAGVQLSESKFESLDDLIAETIRDIKRKRKRKK